MPNFLNITELKERLHIAPEVGDYDLELQGYIDAAESYLGDPVNGILHRPVLAQDFVERFRRFEDVCLAFPDEVQTVSVSYVDADGAEQALGDIFTVENGCLVLNHGENWPYARSVTVSYRAGWEPYAVPQAIREAGYFIARSYFEQGDQIDHNRFRSVVAFKVAGFRRATI